ncbi:MAG: metalloregulator ArsR/SmtB family transcription factor [Anaerolineae bacterium]|nr:metalloregulator ArsR/SmtB family transcription factor [Anaerolineae bacterium]
MSLLSLDDTVPVDCVEFCKALADETRQRILEMLLEEDEKCVTDIVAALHVSQPTVSHHLSILRRLGLVTSRREGKLVFYQINREKVVRCCGMLAAKFGGGEC